MRQVSPRGTVPNSTAIYIESESIIARNPDNIARWDRSQFETPPEV
jgi:hypothetical protein